MFIVIGEWLRMIWMLQKITNPHETMIKSLWVIVDGILLNNAHHHQQTMTDHLLVCWWLLYQYFNYQMVEFKYCTHSHNWFSNDNPVLDGFDERLCHWWSHSHGIGFENPMMSLLSYLNESQHVSKHVQHHAWTIVCRMRFRFKRVIYPVGYRWNASADVFMWVSHGLFII